MLKLSNVAHKLHRDAWFHPALNYQSHRDVWVLQHRIQVQILTRCELNRGLQLPSPFVILNLIQGPRTVLFKSALSIPVYVSNHCQGSRLRVLMPAVR